MKKSYLVSGAGSGIGRAIAKRIASQDAESSVILLGRDKGRLEGTRLELPRPEAHRVVAADLKDREGFARAMQGARLEDSNLVAVVANAGIGGENHYGPGDRWDEIIATNLTGTYRLIHESLPALRKSKAPYRNVVVVSSVLARLGIPKYNAYCASKAGLLGLTRSLAGELAHEKILVNAICPGWVDTQMSDDGLKDMAKVFGQTVEEVRRAEMARVPLGKMSTPDEIGALVHFLVSGAQISITGQSFDINGGAVMV